jgi:hypothetical protein
MQHGRGPHSESTEKLDAISLDNVRVQAPSPDLEHGKTMWITNNTTTNDSEEMVAYPRA